MSGRSIAIVGASCRFPGAPNLGAFWDLLASGTDAVSQVDERRWSTRFYYHPNYGEPGKSYTWSAGLIDGVDLFEPAFFGISPREAAQMDPQQRLLLELVWHAAEDAGIPPSKLAGSGTGVYIGASSTDYREVRLGDPASGDTYTMTGGTLSILSNRISYVFDLRGPSLTVDTACSSSMVALHHACEAIRDGRVDTAIVGGVNLLLAPYPFLGFCRASMLSRRGRCFAFDERADGYVRAEGGGAVILKSLAQAQADGDPVRAVILATGVNSDGRTVGLSLPSETAQAALIRTVCAEAGIQAGDLAFFEMHGTGTPAGDPVEAAAVGNALGHARTAPLPIGSVKTNIGHLEPASAMAGLLKAALALDRGVVPPTLHCESPNPNIPFGELNLRLIDRAEPIADGGCAGINSFGFGGTNGHAVLMSPPRRVADQEQGEDGPLPPLILSARTEASLRALANTWHDVLAATPAERAPALLRAAARRRDQHPERLVALGRDVPDTVAVLADYAAGSENPAAIVGTAVREGRLAFVFSGNGAQWPGMAREAYLRSPLFRQAVAPVDDALRPALGWSVGNAIEHGVSPEQLARADIAQPLLFAVQVGIVGVLRRLGIEAAGHIGHSVGEIAAAWAAGALSLGQAARVVVARSRQQERTRGNGRMAALAVGVDAARELLAETGSPLEIGAINATQSITLSGAGEAIDRLGAEARRRGLAFRALDLDFAFHSAAMDPIRDDLLADLSGVAASAPESLLVSTVTGEAVAAGLLDGEYWWRNIRSPVRFSDGLAALVGAGFRIFVEIGPNPVLQSYLHDALRASDGQGRVLGTLSRKPGSSSLEPFAAIAARCHAAGHDITGAGQFDGPEDLSGLPLYPWQKERYWFERTVEGTNPIDPPLDHPLLGFRQQSAVPYWLNHLDPQILPWLADHAVEGVPVLPAAAVLEMALAAARLRRPDAAAIEVADVELRRPLPFDMARLREVRSVISGDDGDWELSSRPRLTDEPFTLHAVARLPTAGDHRPSGLFAKAKASCGEIDADQLYRLAARLGLDYGPRFRTVTSIELLGAEEALAHLDPSVVEEDELDRYLVHPALLDGALQSLLALLADRGAELDGGGFSVLPWRFGRVRVLAPFGRVPHSARLRVTRTGSRSASADIALLDRAGDVVAELSECWFRRIELSRAIPPEDRALRIDLVPAPLGNMASPPPPPPDALSRIPDIVRRLAPRPTASLIQSREHTLLLDAMIGAAALAAVLTVAERAVPFRVGAMVGSGAVAPESATLFAYLLRLLERFGAASETDGAWQIAGADDLPELAEVWRLLLAEAPELVAELALTAAAAAELPRLLVEGLRPPEPTPLPMIEHLLRGSPVSSGGVNLVCAALDEIAADWPQDRPFRVLEIGAEAGATQRFLDHLARSGRAIDYLAASSDLEQAARLAPVVSNVAGASAACWSPGQDPQALGGDDQRRFDLIFAVHASARLPIDAAALTRMHDLLAPGGMLVAVEAAPNPLWDVVFGRYRGWWDDSGDEGYHDPARASPLHSGEGWCSELASAGFVDQDAAALLAGAWPSTVFWGRAPYRKAHPARKPTGSPRRIHLIAPGGSSIDAWHADLVGAGHLVHATDAAEFAVSTSYDAMAAADAEADPIADGPLALLVADGAADEGADPVAAAACLLTTAARIADAAARRRMPLWVVTCGAQQQPESAGDLGIIGAALWGFGRVLINELPGLSLRLIDVAPAMDRSERAAVIAAELTAAVATDATAATAETEIVWSTVGRHVPRLRRGLPPRWASGADPITLTAGAAQQGVGGLDALAWRAAAPRAAGAGEITIDVHAAGLNFRDLMWAMGLVPEEALIDGFTGPTFGLECAGIVRAVGPGVTELAVGDRVAGFAPASLATQVTTAAHAVTRLPPEVDFAAAATMPVAFVTAIYALGTLAQLAPGEIVLIHAAAGGVGLAAIQYAKHRGATVIATAGSDVKRAFLRLAGADHVLDSRNLGFADGVRAITDGRGVDVVLNSLSGEAMEQSLGVLKPFGRFLELGKRDFYLNRRVHLRPLRQNISYFAIDIDQLPTKRPELARSLLDEVSVALRAGAIRPLAHRRFPFGAIGDAFRLMQASGHIGKLVLMPDGNASVRLRHAPGRMLRPDGAYLVTGGTSGFGFAAARWLAQHGAGSIALLSRRGAATPGAAERAAELTGLGAEVRIFAGDVADPAVLREVLTEIRDTQGPLRGVLHAAAAVVDRLAANLDEASAADILRPKLAGALQLDRLTRDDPLELFVMFSSATTLLGAPGQGAYVAANLALEALARQRHAEGRPGLAVAWGPIEDAGYLAERPETREALQRRLGAKPMTARQALDGLSAMLDSGLPAVAFAETSWSDAKRYLPILAAPLFAEIRADAGSSRNDDSLIERLAGLGFDEAVTLLKAVVAEEAANILRLPAGALDPGRPLSEVGMDSLMAIELRLALENRLHVDLPLMSLAEGTSVASIATRLVHAVLSRPQASDLASLAERYEASEEAMHAIATIGRNEPFDADEVTTAAAE